MKMTLPQIIMLNHAAWVNSKRSDERRDRENAADETKKRMDEDDPVVWNGKRFSEMTEDQREEFYTSVFNPPDVEVQDDPSQSEGGR